MKFTVKLYKLDYSENDLTVPSLATVHSLPAAVESVTPVYPSRDELFSYFKAPLSWLDVYKCNYVKVSNFTQVTPSLQREDTFYGWIDEITCISDTEDSQVVGVRWHIDPWRTYVTSASMGYATVTRRKYDSNEQIGTSRPVQTIPSVCQRLAANSVLSLVHENTVGPYTVNFAHCIMAYSEGSGQTAKIRYGVWPVAFDASDRKKTYRIKRQGTEGDIFIPSLWEVFSGDFGTIFGIDPANVKGVWLSFVSPLGFVYSYSPSTSSIIFGYEKRDHTVIGRSLAHRATVVDTDDIVSEANTEQFVMDDFTSDEFSTHCIFDENGDIVGSFPPGITIHRGVRAHVVVSASGCYQVFRPGGTIGTDDYKKAAAEGCEFRLPCLQIPVTDNSWASYVYSGQREYEISTRRLNMDASLAKGLMGAGTSAAQGAMVGAISNKASSGTLAGTGLATGIVSSVGGYAVDRMAADQLQSLTDTQKAMQSDALLFYGATLGAFTFLTPAFGPFFGTLKTDDYSVQKWTVHANIYGIEVQEAVTDLKNYIQNYTGPLQVSNAEIGGIPNDAARYIKSRLANGVIIKSS